MLTGLGMKLWKLLQLGLRIYVQMFISYRKKMITTTVHLTLVEPLKACLVGASLILELGMVCCCKSLQSKGTAVRISPGMGCPLLVFDSIGVVVCFAIATAIASPLPLLLFRDAAADVVAIAFYITWFSNLTGTDYSEGAIVLAQNLATRNGYPNINFLVCDIVKISFAYFGMIITNGT
ncbi:hypothetical protein GW17_00007403 [Ensete ventricosum]|nr:hypothetical protein GW17_00007403 [Ensete ventricosum]